MKIILSKFAGIGDTLLTTPAVRMLRKQFPSADIIYLTNQYGSIVLKNNPDISKVIIMDKDPWRTRIGPISLPIRRYHIVYKELYKDLNSNPVADILIDWTGSYSGYCAIKHIKAKIKIGFALTGRRSYINRFYTHALPDTNLRYQGIRFIETLSFLKIESNDLRLEYKGIVENNKAESDLFLENNGIKKSYILINVSGSQPYKQWPPEKFISLAAQLKDRTSLPIVLFSGNTPHEKQDAQTIREAIQTTWLPDEFSFETKAAAIKKSALFITLDTGWKHIAVALGTPTLTIFGSVPATEWHPPFDDKHLFVTHFDEIRDIADIRNTKNIRSIEVSEVLALIEKQLKG